MSDIPSPKRTFLDLCNEAGVEYERLAQERLDARYVQKTGYGRVGGPVPGGKPVTGVVVFAGRVFAANEDDAYFLDDNGEWISLSAIKEALCGGVRI